MSLIQHVTQQEGTDREEALVDLFLPPVDRQISRQEATERRLSLESAISGIGFLGAQGKSVRRIISYDVLPRPEEPVSGEEYGGLTPYKVSTSRRVGKRFPVWPTSKFQPLIYHHSSGHRNGPRVLVRQRDCLWFCSA